MNREEARRLAEELFNWMEDWDRFAFAVRRIRELLGQVEPGDAPVLNEFYELSELYNTARQYRAELDALIRDLRPLVERARRSEGVPREA